MYLHLHVDPTSSLERKQKGSILFAEIVGHNWSFGSALLGWKRQQVLWVGEHAGRLSPETPKKLQIGEKSVQGRFLESGK